MVKSSEGAFAVAIVWLLFPDFIRKLKMASAEKLLRIIFLIGDG